LLQALHSVSDWTIGKLTMPELQRQKTKHFFRESSGIGEGRQHTLQTIPLEITAIQTRLTEQDVFQLPVDLVLHPLRVGHREPCFPSMQSLRRHIPLKRAFEDSFHGKPFPLEMGW